VHWWLCRLPVAFVTSAEDGVRSMNAAVVSALVAL
jgi:hypothetical protein